ncbi:Aste57867_3992 [Aphanomyces stellatus]|uniref:Aste57867_3992 protein n=1 Tax=Aphanomyces stellatus TaxID=120398 RepID=A0A485KBW0_9STRA|nr:hypothetical protein As57867_003981 [Aphanomyces stellatus]VFT81127.1 Aste57867_3992 [Aphanomyces stellatus]
MTFTSDKSPAMSPSSINAIASFDHSTPASTYVEHGAESVRLLLAREAGADHTQWSEARRTADNIVVYRGVVPHSSWNCIKTTARMQCSAAFLAAKLVDANELTTYDTMSAVCHQVATIDAYTSVRHVQAKPVFPTRARDFVVLTVQTTDAKDDDAAIVIATRSIHHCDVPDDAKHFVRGATLLSGYILRVVNDHTCDLTLIAHLDLGGNIPASLINLLAVDSPIKLVKRLQELYEPTKHNDNRTT